MEYIKQHNERINETLYRGTHSNGLKVFVVPKPGFSKKYAILGTKFGSINNRFIPIGEKEPIDIPDGIAHFLEHKMFEQPDGTNAFDKFSLYGANANAYTSFTNTCYLFSCTDNFKENLEHLISYVESPWYTDENVEKEQGIIGQEIRMYDDDGQWQVMINQLKALYKYHPARIDIAGSVESIAKINKDLLYHCYNSFYNPKNMVLTVCGDVDPDEVFELVEKVADKNRQSQEITSIFPDEPNEVNQKLIETQASVSRPIFSIGFKDNVRVREAELFKREIAINLITKLLVGRSSSLYSRMYNEGLINEEFGTDIMCEENFSCISICGESDNSKQVAKLIMEEISKVRAKGAFDKEHIDRLKKSYIGSFMRNFNDTEDIAGLVHRNALSGIDAFDFFNVFETIDDKYIYEVFDQIFKEEYMAMSIVNPY